MTDGHHTVAGHVVSITASLTTGRYVVAVRPDDGISDDIVMTPREARAFAGWLVKFARRVEVKQGALKNRRRTKEAK